MDIDSREITHTLQGPANHIFVSLSKDANWLATGNWHGNDTGIFDLKTGNLSKTLPLGLTRVAFTADGNYLFCGNGLYEVGSWERRKLDPVGTDLDYDNPLFSINLSCVPVRHPPKGACFYEPNTWTLLASLHTKRREESYSVPFAISPDGSQLIMSVRDRFGFYVDKWNLRSVRQRLREIDLDFDLEPFTTESTNLPISKVTVDVGDCQ